MAIVKWDPDLPQAVLVDGFSYAFAPGRRSQRMDNGFRRSRRRSRGPKRQIASIDGRTDLFGTFERFWEETTNFGVNKFWMPGQMHDGETMLDSETGESVTDEDDDPILGTSWWLCEFDYNDDEAPDIGTVSGTWFKTLFPVLIYPI